MTFLWYEYVKRYRELFIVVSFSLLNFEVHTDIIGRYLVIFNNFVFAAIFILKFLRHRGKRLGEMARKLKQRSTRKVGKVPVLSQYRRELISSKKKLVSTQPIIFMNFMSTKPSEFHFLYPTLSVCR